MVSIIIPLKVLFDVFDIDKKIVFVLKILKTLSLLKFLTDEKTDNHIVFRLNFTFCV
ncbi:hypothetical protein CCAN11_2490004 [Capnocytophaga canimorsus]|uniref:Uncharacterized protein n=1 Tax=Capnocytophaga canimorsus TaxID=28188 RepID=A0A0B7IRS2_9FLAO|nr:hypothetical protein CCAN11_2490004 [Capnocytophaga canimorsus]